MNEKLNKHNLATLQLADFMLTGLVAQFKSEKTIEGVTLNNNVFESLATSAIEGEIASKIQMKDKKDLSKSKTV